LRQREGLGCLGRHIEVLPPPNFAAVISMLSMSPSAWLVRPARLRISESHTEILRKADMQWLVPITDEMAQEAQRQDPPLTFAGAGYLASRRRIERSAEFRLTAQSRAAQSRPATR
jgi:hypothetical protein